MMVYYVYLLVKIDKKWFIYSETKILNHIYLQAVIICLIPTSTILSIGELACTSITVNFTCFMYQNGIQYHAPSEDLDYVKPLAA